MPGSRLVQPTQRIDDVELQPVQARRQLRESDQADEPGLRPATAWWVSPRSSNAIDVTLCYHHPQRREKTPRQGNRSVLARWPRAVTNLPGHMVRRWRYSTCNELSKGGLGDLRHGVGRQRNTFFIQVQLSRRHVRSVGSLDMTMPATLPTVTSSTMTGEFCGKRRHISHFRR